MSQVSNRLTNEESLYLKKHSSNPVNWWCYGPEALQKAKDENKPILLSIGYASCHYCNVMNLESFSDDETAKILNDNFICIKVDRDEHPDVDSYYQVASQLFSRTGGWPLNAFLMPDTKPFYAGTYFPKVSATEGVTSFKDLLAEMIRIFNDDNNLAKENSEKVTDEIANGMIPKDKVDFQGHFPAPMAILKAVDQFKDQEFGGFGTEPKFPNFAFFNWALEQMLEGMIEKSEGEFIIKSLESMLLGGIVDHVKGGIHRYSKDQSWTVPHFEKMLFDQAGLLRVLSKLSLIYPAPLVFDTIINTLNYLETEMLSSKNYFFSSQSSESEGEEGLYYTYTEDEFVDALNDADDEEETFAKNMDKIKSWFSVTKDGNYTSPLCILRFSTEHKEEIYSQDGWDLVRKVVAVIANDRKERIPPQTDTKGIASWNFQLASSLLDLMQYCRIDIIRHKANELFNRALQGTYETFISKNEHGKMKISHSTTRPNNTPFLEDYVYFAELQLRTYELTANTVFKENFSTTLKFIQDEFIHDDVVLTRPKESTELEEYPNQEVNSFDNAFRSPASVLIDLSRRATVLFSDQEILEPLELVMEKFTNEALKNPINSGEALRALSYPKDVYRVIKAPKDWPTNANFVTHMPFFMSRFVIDYHDDGQKWQINNLTECEIQGEGIDTLIEMLIPKQEEK